MNIQIESDNITDFEGDAIICPCDCDLTYKKTGIVQNLLDQGGSDLIRELTSIGYCELGNAIIVKGHDLKTKNIIFMPISDHNNEDIRTNYLALHQSLRNAFTLAEIYKAKSVAIGAIGMIKKRKRLWDFINKLPGNLFEEGVELQILSSDEVEDIVISISKDFDKSSIKEVHIYKYSK